MSGHAPIAFLAIFALALSGCGDGPGIERADQASRERPCWSPRAQPISGNEPVCGTLRDAARAMLTEVSTVSLGTGDYLFDGQRLLWARTVSLPRPGLEIREWDAAQARFVHRYTADFRSAPTALGLVSWAEAPRLTVLADGAVAACAVVTTPGGEAYYCFVFGPGGARVESFTGVEGGAAALGYQRYTLAPLAGGDLMLAWLTPIDTARYETERGLYVVVLERSHARFRPTVEVEPSASGAGIENHRRSSLDSVASTRGPLLLWAERLQVADEGTYPGEIRPLGERICFGIFEDGNPPSQVSCEPLPDPVDSNDMFGLSRGSGRCLTVDVWANRVRGIDAWAGKSGTRVPAVGGESWVGGFRFGFDPGRHPQPLSDALTALSPTELPDSVVRRCVASILEPR